MNACSRVLMPIAGRVYDRFGARWTGVAGMGLAGVGILMLCRINPDLPRSTLIVAMMLRAAGPGLAMMPITTSGISALPKRLAGAGSAYNQVVQRADSSAVGLAQSGFAGAYGMYAGMQNDVLTQAYSDVFLVGGIASLAGMVLALFLPARKGA